MAQIRYKKYALFLAAIILSFFGTTSRAEDVTAAFTKCALTKIDSARLACYDKIIADIVKSYSSQPAMSSNYQPINLVDLKVDIRDMDGKRVAVQAAIQRIGEIGMIKSSVMDMSPIMANFSKLPRDDRKKLASGCDVALCAGKFFGLIGSDALGPVLLLDRVEWN